jgi:hypothetical protein
VRQLALLRYMFVFPIRIRSVPQISLEHITVAGALGTAPVLSLLEQGVM